ncbi:Probable LRR receptor-like serine/threonine-protein kinase At1g74360 [Linum perenne]
MAEDEADPNPAILFLLFSIILLQVNLVAGDSLAADRDALLGLKSHLISRNRVNPGRYLQWNQSNPCNWPGISCSSDGSRVIGIDLADDNISGELYGNFSSLTALEFLDLSRNSLLGSLPADLSNCQTLAYLNLSHNILRGEVNFTGLRSLEVIDLAKNRFSGGIQFNSPGMCMNLVVANLSENFFIGRVDHSFVGCSKLQYLDLSSNHFVGGLWSGFSKLKEFSASENGFNELHDSDFDENCSLISLDIAENSFTGMLPGNVSNCKNLTILNAGGNHFSGLIPSQIGRISGLASLLLGNNSFSSDIPETLLNLKNLTLVDLSRNSFGGKIQPIFGRFTQAKFMVLSGNAYTGGLHSSGLLSLTNLVGLDLSYNNFSTPLPVELSQMRGLKFLIMAHNQFTGSIPEEYGNLTDIQALDLSFNRLTGSIPSSLGELKYLLWLMLANNTLSGRIPSELGRCNSLLWLNLSNNRLSGTIPSQLMNIGSNPEPTFRLNRENGRAYTGLGECTGMKRWIPADYNPFRFVYSILNTKSCRSLWDRLFNGNGIFPVCAQGTTVRTFEISGYLQLSGNMISGQVPEEIGRMKNFSMLHLGINNFTGELPLQVQQMPLVVLNLTRNLFRGIIPSEIGNIKCLQNLDFSFNNFSGIFPTSLNNLTELSKFNISYNPSISGVIPITGQLATFERDSFLGNPLLVLPKFISNSSDRDPKDRESGKEKTVVHTKWGAFLIFSVLVLAILICGGLSFVIHILGKTPQDTYLLQEGNKFGVEFLTGSSSSDTVKIIRLDKTAFTHADILSATENFSERRIVGRGGFGTVYRGVLPNGRQVAVKKLLREGIEGEKEFRAEMEVLTGNGGHPNLVALHGWCLDGCQRILVYEFMEGGALEDLVADRGRLSWRRRAEIAVDVARALVFLHHECYPAVVHRDVKASNVLLDQEGRARVTDFGLARFVDVGGSHVSTMVAGTVGYVAPEYGQTWQATTKGDVYSYGVLLMELATGRRAVDGGEEECLVEWARRVMVSGGGGGGGGRGMVSATEGAAEMWELLRIGVRCTAEAPQRRPNMKEVLGMLVKMLAGGYGGVDLPPPR